jgi:phosphatidylglycerophosphatase A
VTQGRVLPTKISRAEPALWLVTWFGAGLLPKMPGTWGALAALPFAWALASIGGGWLVIAAAAGVFAIGLWASERYMRIVQVHDPSTVVIDEVVAQWLTLAFVPLDPVLYMLAFFLFRTADVLKPWPASWVDRRVGGAIGVMADDLVAAVYAAIPLWTIVELFVA